MPSVLQWLFVAAIEHFYGACSCFYCHFALYVIASASARRSLLYLFTEFYPVGFRRGKTMWLFPKATAVRSPIKSTMICGGCLRFLPCLPYIQRNYLPSVHFSSCFMFAALSTPVVLMKIFLVSIYANNSG